MYLQDESYEEVYTVSGSSSQDHSDSEPDIVTVVATLPRGQTSGAKSSILVTKNSTPSEDTSRDGSSLSVSRSVSSTTGNKVGPVIPRSLSPQLPVQGHNVQGQRSKTPRLNDFAKESLANRYKINKTPDRELNVRQRLSKTPDREIGASRRYSFSASKRLSKSCDSLDSSGNGSREGVVGFDTGTGASSGKTKGKLKEHRRKGKRAATVHTLDTDQLLLILNLQMRYLQETREQQTNGPNTTQSVPRRAITPQPVSQRTVIPQKVRSHTPQPRRANQRNRDQGQYNTYTQNYGWNLQSQGGVNTVNSESSSRRTSESSERNLDTVTGPSKGHMVYMQGNSVGSESYLLSQQMHKTSPKVNEGHQPYIHTQFQNSSADNVHFVTYSDSMLNNPPNKPKTRASVQSHFLPPQPLRRGLHNQLPPQPVSRQKSAEQQLPPQPVQRGTSAFHKVDRSSKSRSPSVSNDRIAEKIDSTPKRKTRKDCADIAIRENFSLNPKPFILKESMNAENNFGKQGQQPLNQKTNFMVKNEKYFPGESLPPYSGPPSYKEHVSSCSTSVTSSLSSNPDDVYSLPKRRVVSEQETAGQNNTDANSTNSQQFSYGAKIYENAEITLNDNFQRQIRSQNKEIIYSSPAKSKVKQCIVPEDYYTQIGKISRDNRYTSQVNDEESNRNRGNLAERNNSETMYGESGNRNEPDTIIDRSVSGNIYGNTNSLQGKGIQYSYNSTFHGQIAPDAKYNDYEDVYDTPDNIPEQFVQKSTASVGYPSYSVNTQGMNSAANLTPKSKSKSPKKNNRSPYPVSSVQVNTQHVDYSDSKNINTNKQISDSVENVHAENMKKIPRIKLNDYDVVPTEILEDDVFLNDENKMTENKLKSGIDFDKVTEVGSENMKRVFPPHNDNYQEITDIDVVSENDGSSETVPDFINDDEGYMKMSLPGKNVSVPDFSQPSNQIAPVSAIHEEFSGHVTDITNQELKRQIPDGIENVSGEETEEYEETGV